MLTVRILDPDETVKTPGAVGINTMLLKSPVALPVMESWQDFITWLRNNPEVISMIIMAILAFLGAATTPPETPQK